MADEGGGNQHQAEPAPDRVRAQENQGKQRDSENEPRPPVPCRQVSAEHIRLLGYRYYGSVDWNAISVPNPETRFQGHFKAGRWDGRIGSANMAGKRA
jgi:hypothetical protein